MSNCEILYQENISIRKLPINFNRADLDLFEHELKKMIPATKLLELKDVKVDSNGLLFHGSKILSESFCSPHYLNAWSPKAKIKFLVKNHLFKYKKRLNQDVLWFTDNWSKAYFHWMSDALPRLFTIQDKIANSTILLPYAYKKEKYICPSLKPFAIQNIKFINDDEIFLCKNIIMPTQTAPSGNYNEGIIRGLRRLYTNFYQMTQANGFTKVYISRSKAQKRKIANEEEITNILTEYGFQTVCFEEHSFEQQVNTALNARYIVSNHGAGLTNMLFMPPESNVFELRKKGDAHNNCYFSLASALNLKYFYQICDSENPGEKSYTANIIVDSQLFRKNIELMLAN